MEWKIIENKDKIMRKKIRINEATLKKMIAEGVKRVLKESSMSPEDAAKDAADKASVAAKAAASHTVVPGPDFNKAIDYYSQFGNYAIIPIVNFEDAQKYADKVDNWCICSDERLFNHYNANYDIFFCISEDADVTPKKPKPEEGYPLDIYGLSVFALCLNRGNDSANDFYTVSRWDTPADLTSEQLTMLLGDNYRGKLMAKMAAAKARMAADAAASSTRISESKLKKIVYESVKRVLKESAASAINNDCVEEDDVLISDRRVFGDDEEHSYNFKCYDGYAIGTPSNEEDEFGPHQIRMEYPTRDDVLSNERKTDYVLKYRGLHDLGADDITYGDIMVAFGKITK